MINLKTQTVCIIICHHNFTVTGKDTLVDKIIERTTIGCSHIEVSRKLTQFYEKVQRLAIAIEFEVRVSLCNFNPSLQILKREKVARLVYPNQLGIACLKVLQCNVNLIGSVINTHTQVFSNGRKIVGTVKECPVILHLRRCSKATEDGVLSVLNRTLAVAINNCKRFAEHSTRARLACRQVKDQGLGAKLGVTFGEGEHRSRVVVGALSPPLKLVWHPLGGLGAVGGHCPSWHKVRNLQPSVCHSLYQPRRSFCHCVNVGTHGSL